MKKKKLIALIVVFSLLFCSCTSLKNYFKQVPSYDQKSYESFTYLKADVLMFYDTFLHGIDEKSYGEFIARFNRMKEYEAGKKGNEEITNQLEIIRKMFERHCEEVRAAPYSEVILKDKKEIIAMAFDVVIATEYAKK